VPPAFDRLVRACLVKDPAARWQTAHDAALTLGGIVEDRRQQPGAPVVARARMPWLPWALAALSVLAAAFLWLRPGRVVAPSGGPLEIQLVRPPGTTFFQFVEGLTFALSPDGGRLAFIARGPTGATQIWIRSLTALDAKPVPGTERAVSLFWSPDGQLAWFISGALKRLDAASGIAVPVCNVQPGIGYVGTWSSTGKILFGSNEGTSIQSVSDHGGEISTVVKTDPARKEIRLDYPWFLPDGQRFLYSARLQDGTNRLMIGAEGRPSIVLGRIDSNAQYVEPASLVFVTEGTLVTQGVDLAAGTLVGAPVPVADSVFFFLSTGVAAFATAPDGTLVYKQQRDRDRLAWVDRAGKETPAVGTPGDYLAVRLAAGGRLAMLTRALPATGTYDIWSLDLQRGTETRITPNDRTTEIAPLLMTGERSLIYSGTLGGPPQLMRKNLETGEEVELLPRGPRFREAYDLTPDGTSLVYGERSETGEHLWIWRLAGTTPPAPLRASGAQASEVRFSPDGRLYTFTSEESGRDEVYVAPLAGGSQQAVSAGGGSRARWSQNGREILYLSADSRVVSVPVPVSSTLQLGKPETLFVVTGKGWVDFDIAADGRLLAMVKDVVAAEEPLTAKLRAIGRATAKSR
jgi:Tol biopolymer transport system component